jgi:hypothetical protein
VPKLNLAVMLWRLSPFRCGGRSSRFPRSRSGVYSFDSPLFLDLFTSSRNPPIVLIGVRSGHREWEMVGLNPMMSIEAVCDITSYESEGFEWKANANCRQPLTRRRVLRREWVSSMGPGCVVLPREQRVSGMRRCRDESEKKDTQRFHSLFILLVRYREAPMNDRNRAGWGRRGGSR